MLQLTFIFGTRPEAIKLAPVILEAKKRGHDVEVLLTGQHREMARSMLQFFGIEADQDLDLMQPGQTPIGVSAKLLQALETRLPPKKRDWVLVQGDTTSAFVAGYWAFLHRIPVAHVEAGLRTYDLSAPFPEEANRQLLSRMSRIHFAPTRKAFDCLRKEGISKSAIQVVGNSGIDAVLKVRQTLKDRPTSSLPKQVQDFLSPDSPLVLVTAHRRESFGAPLERICQGILRIAAKRPDSRIVFPVHPNPQVQGVVQKQLSGKANILLIDPLDYVPFVELMDRARVLLTDSGGIQEEAPSLRKPVIVLRGTTERPEGIQAGFSKLVGTDPKKIEATAMRALKKGCEGRGKNPYGDGKTSERIVRALEKIRI
jgi:UDP-N-acetylglucosamine 2-epimerase (non-hydrolysing)